MATQSPQNKFQFSRTGEDDKDSKPASSFTTQERPTSLYQPRQPSSFGQTAPGSAFNRSAPPTRPGQPSAFGTRPAGQPSAFGAKPAPQPSAFGARPAAQPATFGARPAAPTPKPFTSLRSQAEPQDNRPAFSSFTRSGDQASSFGQKTAPGGSSFARPAEAPRAASPFRKDLHITDEEFLLIRDFIYQQCGIFIAENRKYLVENRLSNRLKELNLKSYSEYYNFLRFDANKKQELTKLFEVVTTNETSFFRNPPQLDVFQRVVLGQAIDNCRKTGQKRLRIWSAGCSTGEEPYTLAIILYETLRSEISTWDIKITANDLSEAVLAVARQGIYNDYALRTTPKEMIAKYFKKSGNVYHIMPELKRLVSFGPINLSDKEQLRRVEKSNIVFCRNVIIYFDDDMKRKVINAFYDNLQPNGYLIIGHSESLHNISRAFQLEHHKGTILYRKSS